MSLSNYVLIGLGLCMLIVPALCIVAARRFYRASSGADEIDTEDEVLELALDQLSFDQLAQGSAPEATDASGAAGMAGSGLGDVEVGLVPERIVIDGLQPRLECQLGMLNKGASTLVTVRVTSDIVIYRSKEHQAVRPHGPTMRQDTLARLAPGETMRIAAQWMLPDSFLAEIADPDGKGVFLLARARLLGANLAPRTQYFLLGHLLPSSQLVPICNLPEAFTNLGMVNARP